MSAGELNIEQLDDVSGGGVQVVVANDYVGVAGSVGGYGFAVWATGGSVCGSVITPQNPSGSVGHCT